VEGEGFRGAPIGTGRDLTVGRWVLALGDPFGGAGTDLPFVGFGIVADHSTEPERYDAILTDAPINTATVGGPVVDMRGNVVGVSTVAVSPKDASMRYGLNSGIGFVIPIEDVMALLPRLEEEGVVRFRPGYLGVWLANVPEPDGGIRITRVVPGTGAQKGGLRAGDVILAINAMEVADGMALRQVLFSLAPGTTVTLSIRRGEETRTVEVVLSLNPNYRR
jgi:S1-C subfamily serine protease